MHQDSLKIDVTESFSLRAFHWLPRRLGRRLMLFTAVCLVASIMGYGAYSAKQQTDLARKTITAQMAALAHNLATIDAHLIHENDPASIEAITIQTATVPGIFSVLVTDVVGTPVSEVINKNGRWSPRYSFQKVAVPAIAEPSTQVELPDTKAAGRDFLAGSAGIISAWHPLVAASPMGWVRVSYRLDSFDKTAKEIWAQALMVIILSITVALLLLARLLRPSMQALQDATRFAGSLDHTLGAQMEVSTDTTEMQALGNALNLVSTRLYTQNHNLTNQMFALNQHAIVSMTDLNGTIIYANDRFCQISGYSQAELLGQNHRIVKSGFHPPEVFDELWHTITQGRVWHGEVKNRKRNGDFYWVFATIVPLTDVNGLPQQYIGIRTDITAIKALEQSLNEAKSTAEAANRAKSEFLANMSHEIRTPMNGVIGMTDLALDTVLTSTQRNYLNTVKNSAQSLLRILNDILDFSKIEAGRLDIEKIEFNLPQVITDTLKSIEARAVAKGLFMHCELAPDVPAQVIGDPLRIRQVLTNLCDNAIKFTQQGGLTVRVHALVSDVDGYEAQISVCDTGIGIPASKQQAIFAAFSQADSSTTRQFGGTGLGLSICARLVELMGGRIWLESIEQKGSTFHFTVRVGRPVAAPVASEPVLSTLPMTSNTTSQVATGIATTPPASVQRPLLVLLVEDHPVNQMLATTLLKKWGHTVVLAQNGQEAVDLFPNSPWDVVLMDMQMPVMGGLEATERIRAMELPQQRVPIIAVTANAMESDREACLKAGMDDHLPKPINSKNLQAMLERHTAPGRAEGAA
jgi:two-component system sensor histidine kinase/response regulator